MLVVTDDAAASIRNLTTGKGAGGLRIAVRPASDNNNTTELAVTVVGDSPPGDAVVADKGCRVFIQEKVAPMLADKVLDAELASGEGAIQFRITTATKRENQGPEEAEPG